MTTLGRMSQIIVTFKNRVAQSWALIPKFGVYWNPFCTWGSQMSKAPNVHLTNIRECCWRLISFCAGVILNIDVWNSVNDACIFSVIGCGCAITKRSETPEHLEENKCNTLITLRNVILLETTIHTLKI